MQNPERKSRTYPESQLQPGSQTDVHFASVPSGSSQVSGQRLAQAVAAELIEHAENYIGCK